MFNNSATGRNKKAFWDEIVTNKLYSPKVWLFLLSVSVMVSYMVCVWGIRGAIVAGGVIVGLPVMFAIVAYPKFGISVLLITSYLLFFFGKLSLGDHPIGLIMDALEYLLIIGFFVKQKFRKKWDMFANPISYLVIAWILYNFMEVINPNAASVLAWVYTVRTVAIILLMYFVFVFQITEFSFVKLLLKIWLGLSTFAAIWAYIQEVHGYFNFEWRWLRTDPVAMQLYFVMGHWRKFSIFLDPTTFAYNMAVSAVLCLAMLFGPVKVYKKIILGFLVVFFMIAMLFSGTRGGFVLVPACMGLLAIMNFNKRVMLFSAVVGFIFGLLIVMPTSSMLIKRFQTAFSPSNDASYNVRAQNQEFIKPYIRSHPIGGGLGSVGVWAARFSPDSPLAKFPPDSGYVRVAVELGYIGLLLFCTLVFVVLYTGINNFFLIRDPLLKNLTLAMVLVIFAFNIGNFPQQAIVQFPSNILFYLSIALINVLKKLDDEQQRNALNNENQLIN
jgi:hypothetical protein